jgi:hypothetical protein
MRVSAVLAVFVGLVGGAMGGANEPIADNTLGLTAKACAEKYCAGAKDGLELWLSMSSECSSSSTKAVASAATSLAAEDATTAASESLWSPAAVGTVSALLGVTGLMAGFAQGIKV